MVLRTLHLCSGYDGFELALRLAGVESRTVAHVERDAYAAATLVARMEDALLDQAPVWSDLATFDARAWSGAVDLVTAGFPCQPFSAAGGRRGVDDERWLWPAIRRIVRDVGPRLVFLENVPELVGLGLPHVLTDLAELGFDAEWGLLSASAVGAPHKRQRFWLLAYADDDGLPPLGWEPGHDRDARDDADGRGGAELADTEGRGRQAGKRDALIAERPAGRAGITQGAGEDVADTKGLRGVPGNGPGATGENGGSESQAGRLDLPDTAGEGLQGADGSEPEHAKPPRHRWPPGRDDAEGWDRWLAAGGPEPSLRRVADGPPPGLADALHLGGNGLVPLVAAHALAELATRLGIGEVVKR